MVSGISLVAMNFLTTLVSSSFTDSSEGSTENNESGRSMSSAGIGKSLVR